MHFGSKRVDPKIKVLTSVGEPVHFFHRLKLPVVFTVVDPALYSRELFLGGLPAPAPYIFLPAPAQAPSKKAPGCGSPTLVLRLEPRVFDP